MRYYAIRFNFHRETRNLCSKSRFNLAKMVKLTKICGRRPRFFASFFTRKRAISVYPGTISHYFTQDRHILLHFVHISCTFHSNLQILAQITNKSAPNHLKNSKITLHIVKSTCITHTNTKILHQTREIA